MLILSCGGNDTAPVAVESGGGRWQLKGTDALLIGGYGDNFVYDGSNVTPVNGEILIDVDATKETGSIVVTFQGTVRPSAGIVYTGTISIVIEEFGPALSWQEGGIAEDISMHGTTGHGAPIMPEVRGFLAAWNHYTTRVYVDDVLVFDDVFIDSHIMYSDGARDDVTHMIYQADGATPYDPSTPHDSFVDPLDRELHITVGSHVVDMNNFPPYTVWIHLNFESVEIIEAPEGAAR